MMAAPTSSLPRLPLALASVFLAVSVYADDDDERGAPIESLFKTELVFPQSQGEIQLGTLPAYRNGPEGTAFVLPIGIEYGITDSLQFEVEWDAYINADSTEEDESGSGQGNLGLGLMYSWIDTAESGFNFAIGFGYGLASGDGHFLEGGTREDSQELYVIFAKDLEEGSESQLFVQIGVELQKDRRQPMSVVLAGWDEDEDHDAGGGDDDENAPHDPNVWFANIGGYSTWKDAVLSLELNLSEEEEERYVTPGISNRPMDDVEIGVGVAVGLTEEADDYQIIGKLIWEF